MESRMSKSAPHSSPSSASVAHDQGDGNIAATGVSVTSRLHLYRPGPSAGPLEKDAVLRRIRHRRRANRLRDTLISSLLVLQRQQASAPGPDGEGDQPAAWLDDAFSSP